MRAHDHPELPCFSAVAATSARNTSDQRRDDISARDTRGDTSKMVYSGAYNVKHCDIEHTETKRKESSDLLQGQAQMVSRRRMRKKEGDGAGCDGYQQPSFFEDLPAPALDEVAARLVDPSTRGAARLACAALRRAADRRRRSVVVSLSDAATGGAGGGGAPLSDLPRLPERFPCVEALMFSNGGRPHDAAAAAACARALAALPVGAWARIARVRSTAAAPDAGPLTAAAVPALARACPDIVSIEGLRGARSALLAALAPQFPSLQELCLGGTASGPARAAPSTAAALRRLGALRLLRMDCGGGGADILCGALPQLLHLETLDLYFEEPDGLHRVLEACSAIWGGGGDHSPAAAAAAGGLELGADSGGTAPAALGAAAGAGVGTAPCPGAGGSRAGAAAGGPRAGAVGGPRELLLAAPSEWTLCQADVGAVRLPGITRLSLAFE